MDPLHSLLGLKLGHLLAGIAGGMVRALLMGGGWMAAFTSIVVGALTSSYLTPSISKYSASLWFISLDEHATGFLLGVTAMFLCEGVIIMAKNWRKNPTLPGRPT